MASSSAKTLENWSPAITPMRMFSLRIVNLDFYMAPPLPGMDVCYSEFQGRGVREVPVVRIFGSTTSGQKTCLHLHKAFPYFYVPYDGDLPQEVNEALAFVRRLASSIEKAMKMASTVGAKRQHLHSCSLVRGKKYYGYHSNEQLFIKIVLYYPQEVARVSTLLLSGGIMNHKFQPHEAHFPYLLQILIDHNLCGMGYLHLSSLKFRNPLPEAPTDLMSLVKRVKRDFAYKETMPRVDVAAIDHTDDYTSLKQNLLESGMETLPHPPQTVDATSTGVTLGPLPTSRLSSPPSPQIVLKEEPLNTVPPPIFTPATVKEEPLDVPPLVQTPGHSQTTMKEEIFRTVSPFKPPSSASHITTVKEERSDARPPLPVKKKIKEDPLTILTVPKSSSPAVYQTNPDGGSQPEVWLQKSIPADWIWPLLASDNMETIVPSKGLYSRQSTCELEADASVEDILNRGELLFLPLHQAGPEIKMVQSLTPMWEEERARSGEGGPAGSIDPLYQSTARTVPIPSPFEQAMRETLFQIARAEELDSRNSSQKSSQQSDSGSGAEPAIEICTLFGSQQELKISLGTGDNGAASSDEDEAARGQQTQAPVATESKTRLNTAKSTQSGRTLVPSINEDLIRKQLSQRCASQDLDKEVAEFLRWMGATQFEVDDQEDGDPEKKDRQLTQMAFSQIYSSPGMDAALLKALADYENATEQECQEILDCVDESVDDQEDSDHVDHGTKEEGEDNDTVNRPPNYRRQSHQPQAESDRDRAPPSIPQTDGAGDDDELESGEDLRSHPSKRSRYDREDSSASGRSRNSGSRSDLQEPSRRHKREVSLRDMMRKRRERKPGKKDLFSASSSMLDGASSQVSSEFSEGDGNTLTDSGEKTWTLRERNTPQHQKMRVDHRSDSVRNETSSGTTSRSISLEGAYRRKGKVMHKLDSLSNALTSKFGALPLITLKHETADVNCRAEKPLQKGLGVVTERGNPVELRNETSFPSSPGTNMEEEVTSLQETAAVQSRGDDRDCGGGGGQTPFKADQDSSSSWALGVTFSRPEEDVRKGRVKVKQVQPDHSDHDPEVWLPDGDDSVFEQTQFPTVSTPHSPASGQQRPEGVEGNVGERSTAGISSRSPEDLIFSEAEEAAVHSLTNEHGGGLPSEGREEEKVVSIISHETDDSFRPAQVLKPDVSGMVEIRQSEFSRFGSNLLVDFQDRDDVCEKQTQVLRPFIPFLDSRDPNDPSFHLGEAGERDMVDEHDDDVGQTQILELDNRHVTDAPPYTLLLEFVKGEDEAGKADNVAGVFEQTQVMNAGSSQMISPRPGTVRFFQDKDGGHETIDVVPDVLEVYSTQRLGINRMELGGHAEGSEGQGSRIGKGNVFRPTPNLELQMPYRGTFTVPSAKTTETPQEDREVEDAQIPGAVQTSHPTNDPSQFLFCDMSEDSEASYDSEQDRWFRDEEVNAPDLFEDQEIGGHGKENLVDNQEQERLGTFERGGGWAAAAEKARGADTPSASGVQDDDQPLQEDLSRCLEQNPETPGEGERLDDESENTDTKTIIPLNEVPQVVQYDQQMGSPSAAADDTELLCGPELRPTVNPTQYIFTDMSEDSEASYDSDKDCREVLTGEELFEEEVEKEISEAEDEGPTSEADSGLADGGDSHLKSGELRDVSTETERQKSDLAIVDSSPWKAESEVPDPSFSAFKPLHSLENATMEKPESASETGTSRALLTLPGPSGEPLSPSSWGPSTSQKLGTCHLSRNVGELSAGPLLEENRKGEEFKLDLEENEFEETRAQQEVGKDCVTECGIGSQLQKQTALVATQAHSDWKSAIVSSSKPRIEPELTPLIFHQRPPTREQITESFKEIVLNHKEDSVFYGNVKDVSDHPVVRAGLVFDVKSRDAVHLRPFQFGRSSRRSNFQTGSKHRVYVQQESWGHEERLELIAGIPTYTENNGTTTYLITPAKAPPSPLEVRQWLSRQSLQALEPSKRTVAGGQQIFTMDPNTGKLVPVAEIGSDANTQESTPKIGSSQGEDGEFLRPASPKYDERHVLFLSHPLTVPSSHGLSHRGSERSVDILASASAEHNKKSLGGVQATAIGLVQTPSLGLATVASNTNADNSLPPKKLSIELPVEAEVKALVNRNLVGSATARGGKEWRDISQMTALTSPITPLSQSGFRDPASAGLGQQITLLSMEVFAETRGELLPDPRYDAIGCIVLVFHEDGGRSGNRDTTIVLIRDAEAYSLRRFPDGIQDCEVIYLPDEKALLKCFVQLVRLCDPDMVIGWEVQGFSLGLLAERAANLGISLLKQLSRVPPVSSSSSEPFEKELGGEDQLEAGLFDKVPVETVGVDEPIIDDEWGRTHGSGLYIGGRTVLNAWRIMRGEVKLNIYSIEAVAEAVLRRRVPRLPWQTLTRCFVRGPAGGRYHCIEYFIRRAKLTLEIMDQLDLINRTAELARVFGIDFYSVFSRGSQFRVESMMARLAHTQNYLLVSPTRQQVADQPGMQCLPLVMEPESRFYNSPVIVLDFQSLYPSMIIAYNLCYSTCLGKLSADNPKILGVTNLKLEPGALSALKESMIITPNGIMFAPKEVLPGVLPRLLQEILSTRIMVKKAMKTLPPEQRVLERVLNARQFALKLIANVTYGYTAAGFSGRMPCAEIADSIVQCGRLTLERAISMINSHPRWNARVVYGDTDSMFVLCEGRSKDEAFKIGQEIVSTVTEANPPPVTLKMEKVYLPCVLLTKKRYVGYSFESPSQVKPIFDAKGIETIRRDTCPAVAKAVEHSLRILFDTQDLSQVKQYLQRQWGKILSGRVSIQDFVFAKEVRLGTYSARSPVLPPAAIVASKAMAVDPRAEPRYAERIPYVVVHGEPGARLVDMVVDPLTLVSQPSLRLHDMYYITKQIIPACERIFMLVGVDVRAWFSEMPRVYRPPTSKRVSNLMMGARSTKWDPDAGKLKRVRNLRHGTIDQYFLSRHCTICGEFTRAAHLLCSKCSSSPRAAAILLPGRTARLEKEFKHLEAICRHCGGGDGGPEGNIACISLDCSVFFERRKVHRELVAAGAVASDLGYYPPCLPELF
ncbi:hypothetical protein R1sor_021031 [Riccia sorocarpa]|uniref:DNA polymerase zeta catalytic subunit n=1 Tax=Riccia sorocarpa TaxID=122646 RepID=A0ABD3GFW6_9MARC